MKVGDKIKKRGKGYGVISEINEFGYEVKFLKETKFYEHSNIEIYFACVIWALAFGFFLYVIL
jgi:hypothetical protein